MLQVDVEIVPGHTVLVVTDPQIDSLSGDSVTWGVVGESMTKQGMVDNIERFFIAAKAASMLVFISPHCCCPTDRCPQFEGALDRTMHNTRCSIVLVSTQHDRL